MNQHRKNRRGGKQFHSRPGNQKLPLAAKPPASFPHSSTHSLGRGKTHRLFSYDGEVHPFMTRSLFPRCCHDLADTLPPSHYATEIDTGEERERKRTRDRCHQMTVMVRHVHFIHMNKMPFPPHPISLLKDTQDARAEGPSLVLWLINPLCI